MKIHIPAMDSYGTPEEDDSSCGEPTPTPPISPVRDEEDDESSLFDDTMTIDSASETITWKNPVDSEDASSIATIDSLVSLRKTSKSGKRVTFPADEFLVRVIFIPVDCGPSMEELRPCDPESLVDSVTDMSMETLSPIGSTLKHGTRQSPVCKSFETNGLRVGNGFMVNPIASAQFGLSNSHTLGKGLCIQGKPSVTFPKPAPRRRPPSGFLSPSKSEGTLENVPNKSSSKHTEDNKKRILLTESAISKQDVVFADGRNPKSNRMHPASLRKNMSKSLSSVPSRNRLNLTSNEQRFDPTTVKHAQRKVKSASWSNRNSQTSLHNQTHGYKLQGIANRQTALQRLKSASMDDLKPGHLTRAKSMSCDNLKGALTLNNTGLPSASNQGLLCHRSLSANRSFRRSFSARPDQNSNPLGSEGLTTMSPPLPRIHPSPYRQSSMPTLGQRSVTFVEPGGYRERTDSPRSDIGTSGGRVHAMKQASTPSATRKLYAWHMANGTLGKNALLETPSISPMLDCLTKATADSPVPT